MLTARILGPTLRIHVSGGAGHMVLELAEPVQVTARVLGPTLRIYVPGGAGLMVLELAEPVQVTARVLGHPSQDAVSETELRILNGVLREGSQMHFQEEDCFEKMHILPVDSYPLPC